MNWKTISGLVGRKDDASDQQTKRLEIAKLIRIYDSRVTAGVATLIPADVAERLSDFISEMRAYAKRDVALTGLVQLMDVCEPAPGQRVPELKLGAFDSRAQTPLGFRIPMDLDDRLARLLRSLPGIRKRHIISAALDLILTQCESINGGPFPSAQMQPVSQEAGQ
jgi:hypothetical protein